MCLSRGTVEIFVEPVKAPCRLFVLGDSPVAQAILALAQTLGYRVTVAAAAADHAKIPGAATYIDGFALDDLKPGADNSVIVATQGKGDRDALRVALRVGAGYVGMVCSRKKLDALRTRLLEEATDLAPAFAALHAPAGLDIGAKGPEEIALAVFAEIIARRRLGVARGTVESAHDGDLEDALLKTPVRGHPAPAGLSTRMGARNKMLLPVRGQPLIRHVAGRLIEADIGRVHAVTGFEAERIVDALRGLDLDIIFNADFATGQMSSVSAGLRAMPKSTTGVMIALGDMPHLTAADYRLVAGAFRADGGRHIVVPFFNGERGNPIVIPARFMSEITDGELNAGCRKLVARRPNDIFRVEVDRPRLH